MKKQFIKLGVLGSLLSAALFSSANANAACFASNYNVERVLSFGTYGYVYLRPAGSLTNSFYYFVRTTSDKILSTAANAHTDSSRVNVLGDAGTCPTTGVGRYMGNATYVYITE